MIQNTFISFMVVEPKARSGRTSQDQKAWHKVLPRYRRRFGWRQGLVTQAVEKYVAENHGKMRLRLYGCGPEKMLKAVDDLGMKYGVAGQVSLEAPMPCGVGICLGCVINLRAGGHARVCTEGPVFEIGEVLL